MLSIIEKDTTNNVRTFRFQAGTSATQITNTPFACKRGVGLKAAAANTGTIYVGPAGVTAGGTAATDGWPLAAGEEIFLPLDDPRILYAIASAANQQLFVVLV